MLLPRPSQTNQKVRWNSQSLYERDSAFEAGESVEEMWMEEMLSEVFPAQLTRQVAIDQKQAIVTN